MSDSGKAVRKLKAGLKQAGADLTDWRFERGKKHIRVIHTSGRSFNTACTPSDFRAYKNAWSLMKRVAAGVDVSCHSARTGTHSTASKRRRGV